MDVFLEGFLLQAGLILGLGAQNIFVLESGMRKQRHLLVASVCSLCDLLLIFVGVIGAATIFVQIPFLKIAFGVLGVLFLVFYGFTKLGEAWKGMNLVEMNGPVAISFRRVILLSLGFSLLNPHVYLDTVILVGGYSAKYPHIKDRLEFGSGAGAFSVLWFFALALFSSYMSPLLRNPKAMRAVSFVAGLVLLGLSWKIGNEVLQWITT